MKAEAVVCLIPFEKTILYIAGTIHTVGATTSAMGNAFQGNTRSERPTLEKPALSEDIGNMPETPAVAYGRNRHEDIARAPPTAAAGAAVAFVAAIKGERANAILDPARGERGSAAKLRAGAQNCCLHSGRATPWTCLANGAKSRIEDKVIAPLPFCKCGASNTAKSS